MLRTPPNTSRSPLASRGITLVEMLISMAVTLIMMAAVVNLFANIGAGVRKRNASMELGGQLRMARSRLFKDLAGATSAARPKLPSDDHDDGYLEIIEGLYSDKNPTGIALTVDTIIPSSQIDPLDGGGLGDYDDILALTVRSESEPFVAPGRRLNNTTTFWEDGMVESDLAEIIWFAVENPTGDPTLEPGMRTIYRRVLLIAPWVDLSNLPAPTGINAAAYKKFYDDYDISVRIEGPSGGPYIWVPNTLADLTKRENRFAHTGAPPKLNNFPWAMDSRRIRHTITTDHPLWPLEDDRQGEDVMLNDVLAFDLRVYDPGAPLFEYNGYVIEPSADTIFSTVVTGGTLSGFGAFVDLGWDNSYDYNAAASAPSPDFQEERKVGWHPRLPAVLRGTPAVYDTWSYHYETDGVNQDGLSGIDQGTDGIDSNNANGVDDSLERETSPPYDTPLRAMQVKLRIYDRDSRQIREATVTRNFVPQ